MSFPDDNPLYIERKRAPVAVKPFEPFIPCILN